MVQLKFPLGILRLNSPHHYTANKMVANERVCYHFIVILTSSATLNSNIVFFLYTKGLPIKLLKLNCFFLKKCFDFEQTNFHFSLFNDKLLLANSLLRKCLRFLSMN